MSIGLTYTRRSTSAETTKQLAATLAPHLRAGDAIVLSGDLGAGKTQFVQGVARGLGIRDQITSPTFNILLYYENAAGVPLYHFDLYRLDTPLQLEDIGYYEILDGPGATFIEWGEKFPSELPSDYLEITLTLEDDQTRIVKACAYGERSRRLLFLWAQDSKSRLVK
ncbi:MAG: tRNA (adenosine(37)-N6)-threonylcarbamoyltransferase complex ATPase subunit type 1 TsaE, partial [Coriobacteriaceae bacterium]|nr:tRNA (adenosine(37)-N6)-threonylcarbamoyltransferase complex ATPase subunit type 1 TsaE [Coriobacteriaceae bacterium]